MDDVDTFHIQQTPPPSPYHETTWDLKLDHVQEALLHPKEKKLGYLELYYQGFMEFADDAPPEPEASDDETEYPRWGSMRMKSRDQASMSSATSVVSQDFSTSVTGDSDQHICATPQRMATPDHDKHLHDFHSAISSHPKSLRSKRYPKRPAKHSQKHGSATKRHAVIGKSRISKEYPTHAHTIRTRSKIYSRYQS